MAIAWRRDRTVSEHIVCATLVIAAALALRATLVEWCLLALCVGAVIGAELFNTALEELARAIDTEHNPRIGAALDMAAAAVLVVAVAAAVVGGTVFGYRLGLMLAWWSA